MIGDLVGNMADRTFELIDRKIRIKTCVKDKKISAVEVCCFLGISSKIYDMIFGVSNGMKIHEIPDIIHENMLNLLDVIPKLDRKKTPDLHTQKKEKVYRRSLYYLNLLFDKNEINRFWIFVNSSTHHDTYWNPVKPTSEASLINLACTYTRSDIDRFERIWWYLTMILAKLIDAHRPIDQDPALIATTILGGKSYYYSIVNGLIDRTFNQSNMREPTPDFRKLFFKFEGNIPAMFWNSTLFPVVFPPK